MQTIPMIRGFKQAGEGDIILLNEREKQFTAVLIDADNDEGASVTIWALPDGDKTRRIWMAELSLSANHPSDIAPIQELLIGHYYAELTGIDGGEVWVYGSTANGSN